MKKTRKFAALVAAMMCISGMGAMNAFADNVDTIDTNGSNPVSAVSVTVDNDDNTKEADAKLYVGKNVIVTKAQNAPTATWNVVVSTSDSLTWTVSGTRTDTYNIAWNPETHTYSMTDMTGQSYGDTKEVAGGNQSITFTNNSNFDISGSTGVYGTDGTSSATLFKVTCGDSKVNTGYSETEATTAFSNVGKAVTKTITVIPNETELKALIGDNDETGNVDAAFSALVKTTFTGATDALYTYADNNSGS